MRCSDYVNNAPCKIVRIGTVKIRMFNGAIRTFTNVRYIPELKWNRISLSTLNSKVIDTLVNVEFLRWTEVLLLS